MRRVGGAKAGRCVLVFQGGGALGSYQAGTFEALEANGLHPDWVAGISIGAINAAIIAGNRPEDRVAKLAQFWRQSSIVTVPAPPAAPETLQLWWNTWVAANIASWGIPGFFKPPLISALVQPPGTARALSIYDTSELRTTLEQLVDFDRINARETRLSVGV